MGAPHPPLRHTGLAAIVLCFAQGCAALPSPFVLLDPRDPPSAAPASSELELSALEARPAGMLVRMSWSDQSRSLDGKRLELFRAEGDDDPMLFYRVTLQGDALDALVSRGLVFYDKEVEPGQRYRYILRVVMEEDEERTPLETILAPPIELTWRAPVGAPAQVMARADFPDVVELRWTPKPGWGVLVFKRPVGERPRRLTDLSTGIGDGLALDHDVEPGRSYAYRIAYVRRDEGYPVFGQPSSELYVSVPTPEDIAPAAPRAPLAPDEVQAPRERKAD